MGNQEFARLKRLLLDRGVTILMAGDTHDFEYYAEPPREGTGRALLRERRRRRVSEPGHGAGLAGRPADR